MRFFVALSIAVSVCEATSPGLRRYRNILEISDLQESAAKAAAFTSESRNDNKHRTQLQSIHEVHENNKHSDNRIEEIQTNTVRTLKKGAKGEKETRNDGTKKKDQGKMDRNDKTFGGHVKNLDEIIGYSYGSLSLSMSMPSTPPIEPYPTPSVAPVKSNAPVPVNTETSAPVESTTITPAPYASTTAAPVVTPVVAPVTAPVVVPLPTPVAAPVVAPVATPVYTPEGAPVVAPVVAPVTAPLVAPIIAPVVAPVAAPVVAPLPTPVVAPVDVPVTPTSVMPVVPTSTIPTDYGTSTPTVSGGISTTVAPSAAPVVATVPSAAPAAPITVPPVVGVVSDAPAAPISAMPVAAVPSVAPVAPTTVVSPASVPSNSPALAAPITIPPVLLLLTESPIVPTLTTLSPLTPVIFEFSRSPVSNSVTNTPSGDTSSPGTQGSILPTALLTRDEQIVKKCNVTADERFAAMIGILADVADVVQMGVAGTPQNLALTWLDAGDDAIICPDAGRVTQRYLAAVFYYGMGGTTWINCRAVTHGEGCINATATRDPIRFLSAEHECYWFGLGCGVDVPVDLSADDPRDLILIELPENNLMGSLVTEIFALRSLQVLTMDGNLKITGTIPSLIGDLLDLEFIDMDTNALTGSLPSELWQLSKMRVIDLNSNGFTGTLSPEIRHLAGLNVLQLENNKLTGPIPTDALLNMTKMGKSFAPIFVLATVPNNFLIHFRVIVALTLENNLMTGNVVPICDVLTPRRQDFDTYLRFFHVDCLTSPPEVVCTAGCCTCF